MQNQSPAITEIRRVGVSKINTLVRAARQLDVLRPAFAEWQAGEIYVCKKTGSYRYRFGANSKSPAIWSSVAEKLFPTPAAFAFAAMVLGPEQSVSEKRESVSSTVPVPPKAPAFVSSRVDVVALAANAGGAR